MAQGGTIVVIVINGRAAVELLCLVLVTQFHSQTST